MPVQWFPGHMAKAQRALAEDLGLVDVVIEVVDARIPGASSNPNLERLLRGKPRLVLLNKVDLAAPAGTANWARAWAARGVAAVPFSATGNVGVREALAGVAATYAPRRQAQVARGINPRPARAMVVGIPNVGKSAVINRLVGAKRAVTGDKPGVTRGRQWVRAGKEIELLDTPGILQPKIEDVKAGYLLAAVGAVRDEVFDPMEVAGYLLPDLLRLAPAAVGERFGLTALAPSPEENLATVARARGLLRPGGLPDVERAAALILRELRDGRLGRLTLEEPAIP